MTLPEQTALQNRRTALQRDIYRWTVIQGKYMPHIQHARFTGDFTFASIQGKPLARGAVYVDATNISTETLPGARTLDPVHTAVNGEWIFEKPPCTHTCVSYYPQCYNLNAEFIIPSGETETSRKVTNQNPSPKEWG
jgi:hypothetical protein